MESLLYKTVEIVGTNHGNNGRMCGLHPLNCGSSLQVGTHIKLRNAIIQVPKEIIVQEINNRPASVGVKSRGRPKKIIQESRTEVVIVDEPTIKAFVWKNGVESCCVGFVSLSFQNIYGNSLDGRIIDVRRILNESDSESEKLRSDENNGIVQGIIIS